MTMRAFGLTLAAWATLCLPGFGQDRADLPDEQKIVGTWIATAGEASGSAIRFYADGRVWVLVPIKDRGVSLEGSYTISDHTITTTLEMKGGQKTTTTTRIRKLTARELVTVDGASHVTEFKRKK
jgi:uncharacterized protein (TIGR03066 family)